MSIVKYSAGIKFGALQYQETIIQSLKHSKLSSFYKLLAKEVWIIPKNDMHKQLSQGTILNS